MQGYLFSLHEIAFPGKAEKSLDRDKIRDLLIHLSKGNVSVDETLERLKSLPFENIGFACIDHHRALRTGLSEVIFAEGKEVPDILTIMARILDQGQNVLATRLSEKKATMILDEFPDSTYYKRSKALTLVRHPVKTSGRGRILIMSAGTSDIPVAEEAAITAGFMGNEVDIVYDVGISGLHRVLACRDKIEGASVIVVVAGMEGALPSVVGGLVDKPVIAVPTSVGYGASFSGIAALLGMLNSCAAGITVVNIDNGFGAGYAASMINRI